MYTGKMRQRNRSSNANVLTDDTTNNAYKYQMYEWTKWISTVWENIVHLFKQIHKNVIIIILRLFFYSLLLNSCSKFQQKPPHIFTYASHWMLHLARTSRKERREKERKEIAAHKFSFSPHFAVWVHDESESKKEANERTKKESWNSRKVSNILHKYINIISFFRAIKWLTSHHINERRRRQQSNRCVAAVAVAKTMAATTKVSAPAKA